MNKNFILLSVGVMLLASGCSNDIPEPDINQGNISDGQARYISVAVSGLPDANTPSRGYEKIMKAFDKANLKRPEFTVEQGGVTATIYREIFMSVRGDSKSNQTEPKPNQNRTKTEQKNIIIELIRENPTITRVGLAEKMELHESSVQRRLEALVKEGKLRHLGPTNGGIWEVIE